MDARLCRPRVYDLDVHVALDAQISPQYVERLFTGRIHGEFRTRERVSDGANEYMLAIRVLHMRVQCVCQA